MRRQLPTTTRASFHGTDDDRSSVDLVHPEDMSPNPYQPKKCVKRYLLAILLSI